MLKRIVCCILCAVMMLGIAPVFASAREEDMKFYKFRVDAGEGVHIEKFILEEDELYIPAANFSRYTRYRFDEDSMTFLVKGQEADKAFKKVIISEEEKKVYVLSDGFWTVVELSNCYRVDEVLYLPFCQMLPILNAQILSVDPSLTGSVLISNNPLSMAELLYDFNLGDYAYDLSEEFFDNEWLLIGYSIPSYLFDSVKDFRFDRLDFIADTGTYRDYEEIFTDYLKDEALYIKATSELEDARIVLNLLTGINDETEKFYDLLDWIDKLEGKDITLQPKELMKLFSEAKKFGKYDEDPFALLTAVHSDELGISMADMIEGVDYIYTYLNHVEENHEMLAAVYDVSFDGIFTDAQNRAAKSVYDLYEGEFLVYLGEYGLKQWAKKTLEKSAGGKTFLAYELTAKVGGEIMEIVMPGDSADVSRLTLHAGIASEAMVKAGAGSVETEEQTEAYRLSLLLMMIASRKCYQIMAETAEGYGHNAGDYRAKIEKLENMIMGLYLLKDNVRFDTFEHFGSLAERNRAFLKEARIFSNPEEIQPGDEIVVDNAVYMDYLRAHPEYRYYALVDVNQDGVPELLATDTLDLGPERYDYLFVYKNGRLVEEKRIWNKYTPMIYDSKNLWLGSQDGGTGAGMTFYYLDEELTVRETGFYWSNADDQLYIDNIPVTDEILQDAYDDLVRRWSEGDNQEVVFTPVP